jgi:hypothetical protein
MAYNVFKSGPRKGQPKTLTDRVVRYFEDGLGMKEVLCRSGKYRQFAINGCMDSYFVGSKGAVRFGTCASKSVSLSHKMIGEIEKWERTLVDKG